MRLPYDAPLMACISSQSNATNAAGQQLQTDAAQGRVAIGCASTGRWAGNDARRKALCFEVFSCGEIIGVAMAELKQLVIIWTLHLCLFICGFIVTICMGLSKSNFDSSCPLYMEIKWRDPDNFYVMQMGRPSVCDYVTYLPLLACILYPFIMMIIYGYVIFQVNKGKKDVESKILKLIPLLVVNCIWFLLMFVVAGIITTGRRNSCSYIVQRPVRFGGQFDPNFSCFQIERWKWPYDKYRPSYFVRKIVTAEVAAWISLIFWISLIVLSALKFLKMRRETINAGDTKKSHDGVNYM